MGKRCCLPSTTIRIESVWSPHQPAIVLTDFSCWSRKWVYIIFIDLVNNLIKATSYSPISLFCKKKERVKPTWNTCETTLLQLRAVTKWLCDGIYHTSSHVFVHVRLMWYPDGQSPQRADGLNASPSRTMYRVRSPWRPASSTDLSHGLYSATTTEKACPQLKNNQ